MQKHNYRTMALYHTYRPQTFAEVVNQKHIITTLQNQLLSEKVAHAYLFSGPRGIGKTTTARILAKAINCLDKKKKQTEPCNKCETCQSISKGHAIDIIEIDAASHTGVDMVREHIIENAQFQPTSAKHKVFIIDEVHMLSTSAFNALLKTLEEPPSHAMFILATTEKHKLPQTIISRCQQFQFTHISNVELVDYLKSLSKKEGHSVEDEVLQKIATISEGCLRDALSLLDQLFASGEKKITTAIANEILPASASKEAIELAEGLIKKEAQKALEQLSSLQSNGTNMQQLAIDVLDVLRNMLLCKANITNHLSILPQELSEKLLTLSKNIEALQLVKLIDMWEKRRQMIRYSSIPTLPLEIAIISWCNQDTTFIPKQNSPKPTISPKTTTDQNIKPKINQNVEKTIIEENKNTPKNINTENKDINTIWSECITIIEKESPSLVFILNAVEISQNSPDKISLSVKFDFHKDQLEKPESKRQIETILSSKLQKPVTIEIDVKSNPVATESKNIQELAAAFGGEIVN